ncbi:hypothetical protein D1164_05865 [Mariniphaga sediminis]|uniref:Uncharacterized protein n=1 Tax=Mariniphaga sediminis TaxID=1628158 RepID=A0A399D4M8_9BACT|nr:hypothetical protein D1164_05865 [Mariniphaga sediminis]
MYFHLFYCRSANIEFFPEISDNILLKNGIAHIIFKYYYFRGLLFPELWKLLILRPLIKKSR